MSTKSLPSEQLDSVRDFARRVLKDRFGGNQSAMAKATGIAQSTISDAISRGAAGPKTLEQLAKAGHATIDEVLGRATKAATARSEEPADLYPNRTAFLALHDDQLTPQTKAYVIEFARSHGDMPIEEWRALAKKAERDRAEFGRELPPTGTGIDDVSGFGEGKPAPKRKRKA